MNKYAVLSIVVFFVFAGIFVTPTMKEPVYRNSTATLWVQTKTTGIVYDSGTSAVYLVKFSDTMTIGENKYWLAVNYITVGGEKYRITSVAFTYPSAMFPSFEKTITVDGETLTFTKGFIRPVTGMIFYIDVGLVMLGIIFLSALVLIHVYFVGNKKDLTYMLILLAAEIVVVLWTML